MGFRFLGCHTLAAFNGVDFLIPSKYSLKTDFFGAAVRGFREKMTNAEAKDNISAWEEWWSIATRGSSAS